MDKISVIIPCYNVEAYIDRCLESVVKQTIGLDMLEIIVINDASVDGTLDRLYQWEKRYPENIMVITYEENLRQGGARNLGLQYATGEYIGFVDADDWIEPDMYELLYEKMITGKYDLVKCKHIREAYEGQYSLSRAGQRDAEYHFSPRKGLYYEEVSNTGNCGSYGGLWSGLYKKSMLMEHQIFFPEHLAYEDNFFSGVLQLYVETLYILDVVLYHYFVNTDSTIVSRNAFHHLDRLTTEVMLVEEYKKRGAFEVYYNEIERDFLQRFYINTWYTIFTRFDYIPNIMGEMKHIILELFPNYKERNYVSTNGNIGGILLKLLDIENLRAEDIEKVKEAYITSLRNAGKGVF